MNLIAGALGKPARIEQLSTHVIKDLAAGCGSCLSLMVFEECQLAKSGAYINVLFWCPNCGQRTKVQYKAYNREI